MTDNQQIVVVGVVAALVLLAGQVVVWHAVNGAGW